jgi:hypothetical protein
MHGMKGIIGADRAKGYEGSSYAGDKGGAAGQVGLPHGAGPGRGGGEVIRPNSHGMSADIHFEGGIRGAAVSEPETLPGQYTVRKRGFDEHRFAVDSVHGVAGVEGVHGEGSMDDGGASMSPSEPPDEDPNGGMGMAGKGKHGCKTCGFAAKTAHGYARHVHAKHGYGKLGHGLTSHGDSMQGREFKGETEGPKEMAQVREEFSRARGKIEVTGSSYDRGDHAGSYGRM